ncbi:MAG: hypothetical protein DMG03_27370 [Acidobacteria bacterium]|nr:MAG: hypothetical protein DMG03_27370 [Acidobacteriota bacterium]
MSSSTQLTTSSSASPDRNGTCRRGSRLKRDVTIAQARADVADAARALATADSKTFGRLHTTVTTLRDKQLGDGRPALLLLWAAVGIVLIVACANIVNLLVARNVARTRETSIRQALGASRGQLVVQGLIESGLLAAGGVGGGVVIAQVAAAALTRVDPETFPRLHDVHVDSLVLAFAIGLGLLTTVATGIAPSIQAANVSPPRAMTNAPTRRHRRLQQLLCVAQLGAAVAISSEPISASRRITSSPRRSTRHSGAHTRPMRSPEQCCASSTRCSRFPASARSVRARASRRIQAAS